jgi:hypothetical protein
LQERAGRAIRVEPLTDLFTPTKQFPKSAWPYWSWAAFPDLTEFWTPSYCDYVREIFMAQNVSIDQMLDNAEAVNKPQRVVNVGMIENMAELKYRKDGIIKVKQADFDVNKAYQTVTTPSIQTPILVFDTLEKIQEKASGVTADAKGLSDPDGKVGIYEGNKAEAADRFGLLDISYSFGYDRFARLHEIGIRDNLTKKVAIELTGPDGIETVEVKRSDLFKKGDELGISVEASSDDMMTSEAEKEIKMNFLEAQMSAQNAMLAQNPNAPKLINPKKATELEAKIAGFKPEEIAELLDVSEYSTSEIMSEADRDIESLESGETIKPNPAANLAYMQRFVDWLTDHEEDMDDKTFQHFIAYMNSLGKNVGVNIAREVQQHFIQSLNAIQPGAQVPPNIGAVAGGPQPAPQPAQPSAPVSLPPPALPTNAPLQ